LCKASVPLRARPTTVISGTDVRVSARIWRMKAESSVMRTRILSAGVIGASGPSRSFGAKCRAYPVRRIVYLKRGNKTCPEPWRVCVEGDGGSSPAPQASRFSFDRRAKANSKTVIRPEGILPRILAVSSDAYRESHRPRHSSTYSATS